MRSKKKHSPAEQGSSSSSQKNKTGRESKKDNKHASKQSKKKRGEKKKSENANEDQDIEPTKSKIKKKDIKSSKNDKRDKRVSSSSKYEDKLARSSEQKQDILEKHASSTSKHEDEVAQSSKQKGGMKNYLLRKSSAEIGAEKAATEASEMPAAEFLTEIEGTIQAFPTEFQSYLSPNSTSEAEAEKLASVNSEMEESPTTEPLAAEEEADPWSTKEVHEGDDESKMSLRAESVKPSLLKQGDDESKMSMRVESVKSSLLKKGPRASKPSKKKKRKAKDSDSDSSDEGSKRSKKKKKAGKKKEGVETGKLEEKSPAFDIVANILFLLDGIILIAAVYFFITTPSCKSQGTGVTNNQIEDDLSGIYKPIDHSIKPPPLGQFQPDNGGPGGFSSVAFSLTTTPGDLNNSDEVVSPMMIYPVVNPVVNPVVTPSVIPSVNSSVKPSENSSVEPSVKPIVYPVVEPTVKPVPIDPVVPAGSNGLSLIQKDIFHKTFACGLQKMTPNLNPNKKSAMVIASVWPWMARLRKVLLKPSLTLVPVCAGTIVSPRHVISACHCVDRKGLTSDYIVSVENRFDNTDGEESYAVAKVRLHPLCTHVDKGSYGYYTYDILLITLQQAIQFTLEVQPACLPPLQKTLGSKGSNCWSYNWEPGQSNVRFLRQYHMKILSRLECQMRASYVTKTPPSSLTYLKESIAVCTMKTNKAPNCIPESGGPLTCKENGKWTLYGIGSWALNCPIRSVSGVYAAISYSMSWICCFMKDTPSCRGIYCDAAKYGVQ